MNLKQLRAMRWVVAIATLLGIGSSVVMNVIHAPDHPIARFVAAAPPLAVWACIEIITRIPSSSVGLTKLRIAGASIVATGAVVLSYWQQFRAVQSLGFPTWQALIWPIIIDGTMVVTSVSLLEVVRKIRQLNEVLPEPEALPALVAPVTYVTPVTRGGRKCPDGCVCGKHRSRNAMRDLEASYQMPSAPVSGA